MASQHRFRTPEGTYVIFRAWKRAKDGSILWAKDYGLKAWRIVLKEDGTEQGDVNDGGTTANA
jgi:hypothetical protein